MVGGLGISALCAETPSLEQRWLEAQSYFQAGHPNRADALFESMLSQPLLSSQRGVLLVDRALLAMSQDKWEEALDLLRKVELTAQSDTILCCAVATYSAYCLTKLAQESLSQSSSDEKALESAYAEACEALRHVEEATNCEEPKGFAFLMGLRNTAKESLLTAQSLLGQYARLHRTLSDRAFLLERSLRSSLNEVSTLGSSSLSQEQKKPYLEQMAAEGERLVPEWLQLAQDLDSSKAKYVGSAEDDRQGAVETRLLAQAQEFFRAGSQGLTADQLPVALTSWAKSAFLLRLFVAVEAGKDALDLLLATRAKETEVWSEERSLFSEEGQLLSTLYVGLEPEKDAQLQWLLQVLLANEKVTEDQAALDLLFYRALALSESEVLLEAIGLSWRSVGKGGAEAQEKISWDLRVLVRKLFAASTVIPEDAARRASVAAFLRQAFDTLYDGSLPEKDRMKQVSLLLESALQRWDRQAFLTLKLNRLVQTFCKVLERKLRMKSEFDAVSSELTRVRQVADLSSVKANEVLLRKSLSNASSSLDQGLAIQNQGKSAWANWFFEDALFWCEEALKSLGSGASSLCDLLAGAQAEQTDVLSMTREALSFQEGVSKSFQEVLVRRQIHVLETAGPFSDLLLTSLSKAQPEKKQEDLFRDPPWKEVLSLYQLGYRSADEAEVFLSPQNLDLTSAGQRQKEAADYWTQALGLLKSIREATESLSSVQETGQTSPTESASLEEQRRLELLQQLMQEDEALSPISKKPLREVTRPW